MLVWEAEKKKKKERGRKRFFPDTTLTWRHRSKIQTEFSSRTRFSVWGPVMSAPVQSLISSAIIFLSPNLESCMPDFHHFWWQTCRKSTLIIYIGSSFCQPFKESFKCLMEMSDFYDMAGMGWAFWISHQFISLNRLFFFLLFLVS